MSSLSHRILFPVEGSLEPDANNVAGIRRRFLERGVGAGDVLVVTNTYRPGSYADHEGEFMDVFAFGRKGSTTRARGRHFLTRRCTCKMPENHSLSRVG